MNTRMIFLGIIFFLNVNLLAQPANDHCANATPIFLSANQASCIQVDGDTRMTEDATAITETPEVCSNSWYRDDVWFSITIGATVPANGLTVQCEFGSQVDDLLAVGMAFYNSCDSSEIAIKCFSTTDPEENSFDVSAICLSPNQTYIIRVWSGVSPNANSGTFRICAFESNNSSTNVFWGNNSGEGDFAGGLNDWTITSEAPCDSFDLWQWTPEGSTLEASVANNFGDANSQSYTSCNGAMVFNSDGFDFTETCEAPQIGELISPVLDLSTLVPDSTNFISILFYQTTRQFRSKYFVSYTNDGTNWIDIEINDEFMISGPTFNVWKRVFLPGADLTSTNFQFKFRYEGNYYYWIIDDVQIIETEANNLQANNFYSRAPNLFTPASQTDSIRFMIDIENVGASAQTNVNVNMNIVNSSGTEVYNEDLNYGTIAANSLDEKRIFPGHFLPTATVNNYRGTYTVSADDPDFDTSNNSQSFFFGITDSIFAKEGTDNLFGVAPRNLPELSWSIATTYFVRNEEDPVNSNIKYECSSILMGLENVADNVGGFVTIYLYEWQDVNKDGISQATERNGLEAGQLVGKAIYFIDGTENDVLITLNNLINVDQPILLKANTNYVLAAGLTSAGTSKINFSCTNDNNLMATGFLTDSISIGRFGGLWNTTNEDGGLNSDLTQIDLSPRLRMHVNPYDISVASNNPLGKGSKVNIYPNPAIEVVNIKLEKDLSNVVVKIQDINASNKLEFHYENLSNQILSYSVSNFPAGTYFLKIQSDEGYSTKKFTIVK